MVEFIYNLDLRVFYFINNTLSNDLFDFIFPFFRNKFFWIPLYLLIFYLIFKKYQTKSLLITVFAILMILISDQLSSSLIKPFFERLRPCNNNDLSNWINLPIGKGSGWSFVSSHAANHFALAYFFSYFFDGFNGRLFVSVLFFTWAALVAFAQVYIGFHYPIDVFAGAILGIIIAFVASKTCKYFLIKWKKKHLP